MNISGPCEDPVHVEENSVQSGGDNVTRGPVPLMQLEPFPSALPLSGLTRYARIWRSDDQCIAGE